MRATAEEQTPVDDARLKRVTFRAPRQAQLHVVPVRWLVYEPFAAGLPILDGTRRALMCDGTDDTLQAHR